MYSALAEAIESEFDCRVSRETIERFDLYHNLLVKWNKAINLVASSTIQSAIERHFVDSAQIWRYLPRNANKLLDMGSGAGFPGLVLAIIFAEFAIQTEIILVEADQRKCQFLRTVIRELDLSVQVVSERVEDIPRQDSDIITARAFARLDMLLGYMSHHGNSESVGVFLKGANSIHELHDVQTKWRFNLEQYPSRTDPDASVLRIGALKRVS